ncbi:MAG: cytochrome b/b6 domain-containing protein, partial [Burkholderiaceae bacterium]|nr:cytochrome b/b6 domain-containing protein [Burkholderiaceae bacterium]
MAPTKNAAAPTLRVWDLPTRVFHWALVIGVVAMVVTGNLEDDAALGWQFQIGYVIASLLLFRLVWGIFGG